MFIFQNIIHGEKSNHKSNDTQNCQTIKDHAPAPVIDNDTGSLHYSAKNHDSKTLCKSIQNHPDRKQQWTLLCNKSELQWTLPFWRNHYFQWRCGIPRKKGRRSHQSDGKWSWKSGMHKRTVVYFPPQTDAQWYFQPTGMRRTGKDRRGWKRVMKKIVNS